MNPLTPVVPDTDDPLVAEGLAALGDPSGRAVAVIRVVAAVVAVVGLAAGWAGVAAGVGISLAFLGGVLALGMPALLRERGAARRRGAVGAAPALVCRAVLRLRVTPSAETAAAFAARGTGALSARLAEHVRRARGTPATGLDGFAAEWEQDLPALRRACSLLETAASATPEDREATLDRAQTVVRDGVRAEAEDAAADLRGPVTAVYGFGVLLPLALAGALPAARVAGIPVTPTALGFGYGVVLPAALGVATVWLLARRPATAPVVSVPRSHPAVPDRRWPALVGGVVAGGLAWVGAALVVDWAGPLAALAVGVGVALVRFYGPRRAVRDDVRGLERGLPDALAAVGRRVRAGTAVEAAIQRSVDDLDGPVSTALAAAARRQATLRVGVERAFLGEYGAFARTPSDRARSVARLLGLAAREGRPAGDALVSMAGHLDDLAAVERETRRTVRQVTATMANTAACYGPLVGGVTVALADRIGGAGLGPPGIATATLGLVLGWYVLVLAALLTVLSTGLEHGADRALVGYRVGLALVAAAAVYLAAFLAGGLLG